MNLQLTDQGERALLARQRLGPPFSGDLVRPSYDGLGLASIPALVQHWLAPDAPTLSTLPAVPPLDPTLLGLADVTAVWQRWQHDPINHVVVLLMDALGYDQLRAMMVGGAAARLARITNDDRSLLLPITTVFPSTTTTALTSIATGYPPAAHGILGTAVYFREIGSIVNLIGYRPWIGPTPASYQDTQLNPDTLLPVPNVYRRMEAGGVRVELVNVAALQGTSISRFTGAGSLAARERFSGYLTPADGFAQCRRQVLAQPVTERSYTYMYVSTVDSTAHRYGPMHDAYQAEMAALDFALERELLAPLAGRRDVAVILTADHGQRPASPNTTIWLDDHPVLVEMLMLPMTGEGRAPYLHVRHGMEQAVTGYLSEQLGECFAVITRDDARQVGLFGPPGAALGPEAAARSGDLLLVPRGPWVARHQVTTDERWPGFAGVHGGLSREEMLIPFLAMRMG